MTKIEQLQAAVQSLSEEQVEALISFARSMKGKPFYDSALPEALASIDRGLAQIARGDTVSLEELSRRLDDAAKSAGE